MEDVLITPRAFICGNDGTRVEGGRGEGGGDTKHHSPMGAQSGIQLDTDTHHPKGVLWIVVSILENVVLCCQADLVV